MRKVIVGDKVLRHLKVNYPVDIRNLEIENQPSRQRKRAIQRGIAKLIKRKNGK